MTLSTTYSLENQSFRIVHYSNTLRYTKYSIRSNSGVKG
jgi:DNA-binding HxlR family transcriptional regulator